VEQYMLAKCSHPIFLSLHIAKDMSISIVASKTTSWMFKFEQNQRCKVADISTTSRYLLSP